MSQRIQIYGAHGGEVLRVAHENAAKPEDFLDFSSNADSLVNDLTSEIVQSIEYPYQYYPDSDCRQLTNAVAEHEGVNPDNILLGNGSSELIYLLLTSLQPRNVMLVAPIFSEYVRVCEAFSIPCNLHVLKEENDFQLTDGDISMLSSCECDVLVLCTPNNPTGAVYDNMDELLQKARCRVCLVDTTYKEFLHGTDLFEKNSYAHYRSKADHFSTLITINSFTKYFYCTGIRLGYCISDVATISHCHGLQAPWMVSRFAELAGLKFLERLPEYRVLRKGQSTRVDTLRAQLEGAGVFEKIFPSHANYLLCKLRQGLRAKQVFDALQAQSILVRVCDNIPGMPENIIRLQVRDENENEKLVRALAEV